MEKVAETGKAVVDMGVDLVPPALTNPDLVSFAIFVIISSVLQRR